tara:strand:- start:27 stop:446 length:420 start_codon:yes stop_codon:yes gene_type:complete
MAKPITVKQVLKATRKFLDEGRLAAQNRKLKAGGQCRYAYADDPKGFGYHRCALGAAMTKGQLDFLREQGDGGGSQLALGNSLAAIWDHARQEIPFDVDDAGEDALVDLQDQHDAWLRGEVAKKDFVKTLSILEKEYDL